MESAHIDFETCSDLDLNEVGVHRYVEHPSTRILCMGWWLPGRSEPYLWFPGNPLPVSVAVWVNEGKPLSAWSAQFERTVWNSIGVKRYGFPRTTLTQWHDPQAHARQLNLPASLDGAAAALGLSERKDAEGKKLMRRMAAGKDHTPENFVRLGEYCKQDVVVENEIDSTLGEVWRAQERKVYWLSEKINDRGVKIDREFVEIAARAVADYQHWAANEMLCTFGVRPTQVQGIQKFCANRRVVLPDLRADTVQTVLDAPEFYPDEVVKILQMRDLAAGSAPKKFAAMLRAVCHDDYLRGMYSYYGAGQTGRWSGRIVQLQNLARPTRDYAEVREAMERLRRERDWRCLGPEAMDWLLNMVRPSLIPGHGGVFTVGDESQIEARVIAWLAGCKRVLDVFESGQDIYLHNAESVPGADRQVGKVITLAMGFGGGANAFRTMGRGYGVHVSEERAEEIKVAWRKEHPEYVALWTCLYIQAQQVLERAGRNFGRRFRDSPVTVTETYLRVEQNLRDLKIGFTFEGRELLLWLPSGRALRYPGAYSKQRFSEEMYRRYLKDPKLTPEQAWDKAHMPTIFYKSPTGDNMIELTTYGGKFSENLTQAIARDVLAEAMLRVSHKPIVLHSHDEAVIEGECVDALKAAMIERPKWAKTLPLDAKVTLMDRYWKD